MRRFEDLVPAIEVLSDGKNKVLFDDQDAPSIMVVFNKSEFTDIFNEATLNSVFGPFGAYTTAYMSKFQNIVKNGRAYSLPLQNPATDVASSGGNTTVSVSWDYANQVSEAKGTGWVLCPNSLWGAVSHLARVNNTLPHGNNNYGSDINYPNESGTGCYWSGTDLRTCKVLTGSGPTTWYSDHTPYGVSDMNGNVTEWVGGFRHVYGEPQFITIADMVAHRGYSATSDVWNAVSGSGGPLKITNPSATSIYGQNAIRYYINSSGKMALQVTAADGNTTTANTARESWTTYMGTGEFVVETGATTAKDYILIPFGLFPLNTRTTDVYGGQGLWLSPNHNERICTRGGAWDSGSRAGVWYAYMSIARSSTNYNLGFRSAFYE